MFHHLMRSLTLTTRACIGMMSVMTGRIANVKLQRHARVTAIKLLPLAPQQRRWKLAHMTCGRVYLQDALCSCRDAVHMLLEQDISGAPVVDASGKLVGVLSESDLIWKVCRPVMSYLTQCWHNGGEPVL